MPISAEDKASQHYTPGVSCPHCFDKSSDEQKKRFADRQRQVALARRRGRRHVGAQYGVGENEAPAQSKGKR
jgi:UPF0176 protein